MVQIKVKYKPGQKVQTVYEPHCKGVITAVIIRGKGRTYEFGHCHKGEPVCHVVQECEIEPQAEGDTLGFRGNVHKKDLTQNNG